MRDAVRVFIIESCRLVVMCGSDDVAERGENAKMLWHRNGHIHIMQESRVRAAVFVMR